ncbi:MAG: hypothetical protein KAQ71_21410 [Desulfobulbaceae bacterium]|nr:hypothetical protein [Desulfobulbaceae bacterium]
MQAVHYPGLSDSAFHKIATRQFGEKCGGLLSFDMHNADQFFSFMNARSSGGRPI